MYFYNCRYHANESTQSLQIGNRTHSYAVFSIARIFKRDDYLCSHIFLKQKMIYLPNFRLEGYTLLLFLIYSPLQYGYCSKENLGTTPLTLLALLLLPTLPVLFTFMKFVEFDKEGERSHQVLAANQPTTVFRI